MDCSPPGSSVHGDSPGKNAGMGCHALLQGIFPTQGLNAGLSHWRMILYHLSHWGSPRILEWVAYSLPRGNFPMQESNWGLLHCTWILYQLSYLGKWKLKLKVKSLSRVRPFVTPRTVAYLASLSMGFSRQEYWSGLPFPSPGIFPTQGSNPGLLHCRQRLLPSEPPGKPTVYISSPK